MARFVHILIKSYAKQHLIVVFVLIFLAMRLVPARLSCPPVSGPARLVSSGPLPGPMDVIAGQLFIYGAGPARSGGPGRLAGPVDDIARQVVRCARTVWFF